MHRPQQHAIAVGGCVYIVELSTPSITNFKPRAAWRAVRDWLASMQLIQAASGLTRGHRHRGVERSGEVFHERESWLLDHNDGQHDSGTSSVRRHSIETRSFDPSRRMLLSSIVSLTWTARPVIRGNSNCTSIARAVFVTCALRATKTVPVERLAHPDRPGSHHQTPCASVGSTATQTPGWRLSSISTGVAVTMAAGQP